jgi:hypothetical protein
MKVLVVTNPFGGRAVGERITDSGEIASVLVGEHAHHVVQTEHDDETPNQKPSKTSK